MRRHFPFDFVFILLALGLGSAAGGVLYPREGPPDPVLLVSPRDGQLITQDSVTFLWRKGGASTLRYWMELSSDSLFWITIVDSMVVDTMRVLRPFDLSFVSHYYWRVRAFNSEGWGGFSEVRRLYAEVRSVPSSREVTRSTLRQSYPNPFNSSAVISYSVVTREHVGLAVYNLLGQKVATLVDAEQEPGHHEVTFDGAGLTSGVYLCRLSVGGKGETIKLLLSK
jgi:hypothetical protein